MNKHTPHSFSRPLPATPSVPSLAATSGGDLTSPNTTMLTIGEVADLLRISERTVRRMIKDGAITCHRIGRIVRISRDDLRICIENLRS